MHALHSLRQRWVHCWAHAAPRRSASLLIGGGLPTPSPRRLDGVQGDGFIFGMACFSLEGIGLIFPIRGSLQKPQVFTKLFISVATFAVIVYITFVSIKLKPMIQHPFKLR